jgi:ABC transporter substrate binding protein (PQQ-dependent alcohol dehydrogenase system)
VGRLPRADCRTALTFVAVAVLGIAGSWGAPVAQDFRRIPIAYVSQVLERPPKLSNLDLPPPDEGIAGGQLSIRDNNTTGKFLEQEFSLKALSVPPDGDAMAALQALLREGLQFVILNVPAETLLQMADAARGSDVLLFNAGAPDDRLRDTDCRGNVLHIAPSRAMLADALAQYLIWKRWRDWFLVTGRREGDRQFASALKNAAKKFAPN